MKNIQTVQSQVNKARYELNPDLMSGLEESVRYNQQSLALRYAMEVIKEMREEIDELKKVKKAPTRKTVDSLEK